MFFRDYHTIFDGSDKPLFPVTDRVRAERAEDALDRARRNAPQQVIFEFGLVIAVPLAIAVAVTLFLNFAGLSLGS